MNKKYNDIGNESRFELKYNLIGEKIEDSTSDDSLDIDPTNQSDQEPDPLDPSDQSEEQEPDPSDGSDLEVLDPEDNTQDPEIEEGNDLVGG